ncbi:hypothetical protein PG990_013907 [Apiospora arundinis]|uniref:Uncharacterized protein n=1 Tax=Apiospora arundinis TaxID=335852 RepID=A0ABR2IAC4_9PEZI
MATTEFHLFGNLPPEIRHIIKRFKEQNVFM